MVAVVLFGVLLGWRWAVGDKSVEHAEPASVAHEERTASDSREGVEAVAALPSAAFAPGARPDGTVEVCGLGWVKKPEDNDEVQALIARSGVAQAQKRILARLGAEPGEFAQATALLIEMASADEPGVLARIGLVADDRASARDRLARLAASSTDARVYALAYKLCGGASGAGACQLVNAEQWARLEPENAAPWIFMLSTATERKDSAAQAEALHRIAVARYERIGLFAAAGAVLDVAPIDDAAQLATADLITRMIGLEAAVGTPGLLPLVNGCKGAALADANRAQTCAGIAEVMTERSDTLMDRMIGTSIGKNVGWPAERHDRLRGEYAAYSTATMPGGPNDDTFGCAALRRDLGRVRRHAAIGEPAMLREWVEKSGKTPQDFVREERASQQIAERAKQELAASAAAASAAR